MYTFRFGSENANSHKKQHVKGNKEKVVRHLLPIGVLTLSFLVVPGASI